MSLNNYQPLNIDSSDALKSGSSSIINGQSTIQHNQNGSQQIYNSTGTPSSQSSRETSRDPSPTQYLHNQYRPQLTRPPMPPINGQQTNESSGSVQPNPFQTQLPRYPPGVIRPLDPRQQPQHQQQLLNPGTKLIKDQPQINDQRHQTPVNANQPSHLNVLPYSSVNQQHLLQQPPPPPQQQQQLNNSPGQNNQINPLQYSRPLNSNPTPNLFNKNQGQTLQTVPSVPLSNQQFNREVFTNINSNVNPSLSIGQTHPTLPSAQFINNQQQQQPPIQKQQPLIQQQPPPIQKQPPPIQTQPPLIQKQPPPIQQQPPPIQQQQLNFINQPQMDPRLPPVSANANTPVYPTQNYAHNQQNLTSQKRYPPANFNAVPNPASGVTNAINDNMGSRISGPPLPGQQPSPYDNRQPYYGQMSNVPLDSMSKRYPNQIAGVNNYQNDINQLNTQMGRMDVLNSGFNAMWNQHSIDLLQNRNILPAEKIEAPKIKLQQEELESVNCSPDIFRCTLTKIPENDKLLKKTRLPLGILIHPFKDLNHLPLIQCSTIVRCRACRTYINPYVYFIDPKRWKCNLCYRANELPDDFQFDPVSKSYGDPTRRPEVKTSTIEFIAPSEYMLRPPQPAVYLFILDVSRLAVESGYLSIVCNTISEELSKLPGDSRMQVGFLAIDSAVHFFSMPDNVSQPHELIMLDVDDVFLPCPDNLVVNLKEREELVRDLLSQLPSKFNGTLDNNNALGAGLQAAFKLMSATGGRVSVFQTCLPNVGPGSLQSREDPNTRANKDVPYLNPATDFYKRLALDCSGQQIAVDLFLLNGQYCDLATLSGICKFSGGCMHHLPLFRINKPQCRETLDRILRRYLTRKIGFEAVMRIRCTRGLSIHTFHGNFFVRSTDLLSLPNVNPDAGFGMQVAIEENLCDVQSVCFQAALLYTSSKGERRIRVHTLCLPVSSSLSDILYSADQQCIIGLVSKMAVDRSQQTSLSDARDALINVAIDALSAFRLAQPSSTGGLMAPLNLKLLPLYIVALLKSMAFRTGTSTRLDDRIFTMCQMKSLPLSQLMLMVYPDLYPIHNLDDNNGKEIDGRLCPQPPRLHLTAEKLDFRGAFLMDAGDKIYIYIGKNIDPLFCTNVLGVSCYAAIPEEMYDLPELDTMENERLRLFLFSLQEEKPYYASVQIIRDDSHFKNLFIEHLIEDRSEAALSYYEFLQHLKTQIK
ncbi:protein transport protein Sec24A [Microplitis mediator]|uniref:protein transport protein Sec24A n=1 Tax=Microplitis mediator TaxID=375433 RepID=UPI0025556C64|nr:protein transport protein Sec24A [Microplitis mediator]